MIFEVIYDRGADLDLRNLAIKVVRREALTQAVSHKCIMDLSRFCAASSARLGHFTFEGDRTFPA